MIKCYKKYSLKDVNKNYFFYKSNENVFFLTEKNCIRKLRKG